jgi:hypothetical protein
MFKTMRTKAKHFTEDTYEYPTQKLTVHNHIILHIISIQYIFKEKLDNKSAHKMNMLLRRK